MCSSITGSSAPSMASWSATEVWVYAPGLNTAPIEFPALTSRPHSWIQSMSWPSWLDWRKTTSKPSLPASCRHISSTSAREVRPYTSGLRVPSRLRLGPLSTRTDVMASSSRGRSERRVHPGAPDTVVGLARHLRRALDTEVVEVDAERLARREGRDGRDDRAPER